MVPIKEALTFDDVTLVPKYSEILPSGVDTSIKLTESLKLKIPLLSSAMDTVTESRMAIALAKAGGLGVIHRNLDIKKQVLEIRKVKKQSPQMHQLGFKNMPKCLQQRIKNCIEFDIDFETIFGAFWSPNWSLISFDLEAK